jgi:arylformamidase
VSSLRGSGATPQLRMPLVSVEFHGRRFRVGLQAHDLSIPTTFDAGQLECFGAPPARAQALRAGNFIGEVSKGGSCNCFTLTITPHCNGTHTECVGHITHEPLSVRDLCTDPLSIAALLSVPTTRAGATTEASIPAPKHQDLLITRAAIETAARSALGEAPFCSLVIRTLPNDVSKHTRQYSDDPAPYLTSEAAEWIVARDIAHLVVDLPSLDRAEDEGYLTAHRIFWNLAPRSTLLTASTRRHATITELAYIPDHLPDGLYLLNLQVAPFAADAAPSRPVLLSLTPE